MMLSLGRIVGTTDMVEGVRDVSEDRTTATRGSCGQCHGLENLNSRQESRRQSSRSCLQDHCTFRFYSILLLLGKTISVGQGLHRLKSKHKKENLECPFKTTNQSGVYLTGLKGHFSSTRVPGYETRLGSTDAHTLIWLERKGFFISVQKKQLTIQK